MSTDFECRRRWLQAACAVALTPLAGVASARLIGNPPLGTAMDLPSLPVVGGGALPAGQLQPRGVLVLYWWTSWCPVCAMQSPLMHALHQAQSGTDLRVLGVSADKDMAAAQTHLDKNGYSFPSVWASTSPSAVASMLWVPKAAPTVWVYDRAQRLVQAHTGLMPAEAVQKLTRWL
jgi:thiol-disulfide isomerase/thioredoxin